MSKKEKSQSKRNNYLITQMCYIQRKFKLLPQLALLLELLNVILFTVLWFTLCLQFTGQNNMSTVFSLNTTNSTEMPTSPSAKIKCFCSGCKKSNRTCSAKLGCFSARLSEQLVKKGCLDGDLHQKITCQNAMNLVNCCYKSWCNWNNTPPFMTEQPSKLLALHIFIVTVAQCTSLEKCLKPMQEGYLIM